MKIAYPFGFWSALGMAITNLWFYAAFIPYAPAWNAPWPGIAAYATSFQVRPFLQWVIPAFLLPPIVLFMMVSAHRWVREARKVWSLMAVLFAVMYTAVLVPFYYIQITVVPYHLAQGTTEGLPLWLFSFYYPHNIFGAMEGVGYGLLGCSLLCAANAFRDGRLQRWVRLTFVGLGVSVLALFINPIYPLPTALGVGSGFAGLLLGVVAPVLLAILFRGSEPEQDR
ncbi:MAG TPA: hypothetical protein VHO48_13130 [Anaerolineaceae bacterium]|nr:hypothetical protein [Anaerolineaceae bacterium]